MRKRIFLIGVGGQGILLATRLIGEAALYAGFNVSMSEVHGMAQRGGVVESAVVFGNRHSPVLADGEADIVIAFEPLEALRALPKCNKESVIVMNNSPIPPFTVTSGISDYPSISDIEMIVKSKVKAFYSFNGLAVARDAGSDKALNVVMVGIAVGLGLLDIDEALFEKALASLLPDRLLATNIKALNAGIALGQNSVRS